MITDLTPRQVNNRLAVLVLDLPAAVTKVEVQLAVWSKVEGVNSVVVLGSFDACEQDLLAIGLEVAVIIQEKENAIAARDDDLGSLARRGGSYADAVR